MNSLCRLVSALGVLWFATSCAFVPPDQFADDLVIPDELEVEYPVAWEGGGWVPMSSSERRVLIAESQVNPSDELNAKMFEPEYKPKEITDRVLMINDFVLYEGTSGPGTYGFDVWYIGAEDGAIHIRATEVTTGAELSVDSLRQRTSFDVAASRDVATRYEAPRDLTIHEGDIGQFYAASFQVWFSGDGSEDEVMLTERVYVIDGWQH